MTDLEAGGREFGVRQLVGFIAGVTVMALVLVLPPPADLSVAGWRVAGVAMLMVCWWVGEALPVPATALVPVVAFPLLGVTEIGEATRPFANPLIFLFIGGFIIALGMQRWGLHRRLALKILSRVGENPVMIVGGFMAATAVLSMWVSNTATTMMMLPIALSVIDLTTEHRHQDKEAPATKTFALALLLGTAYAASIGGVGTLVGTPPNALLAAYFFETYGVDIGFTEWMLVGVPVSLVFLPVAWYLLTHFVYRIAGTRVRGTEALIAKEVRELGPWNWGEKCVAVVAGITALSWVTRPLLAQQFPEVNLSDAGIALAAALVLFILPVNLRRGEFVMDWSWAKKLPWGILILFGGGLSLAASIKQSGLAHWIVDATGVLGGIPIVLFIVVITIVIVFLTELTSNMATTAAFLPVVTALAVSLGENPLLLAVPAVLAASCAFMLPVATPPNAIVYGSGRVTLPEMARAGLILNLAAIVIISTLAYGLLVLAFGVEAGVVPEWAELGDMRLPRP